MATPPSKPGAEGRPAEIGVLLPTREAALAGTPGAELVALAAEAEALGFDSVWVGDSVLARPRHEPFALLGAVAAATRRVRIGTAVLVATARHPVHLAHAAATLDELSGGRLVLGVGVGPAYGPTRRELAALGVPYERRWERTAAALEVWRALWRGEPVDAYHGDAAVECGPGATGGPCPEAAGAAIAPRPATPGGPPVWLGGSGRRARALAAERFDGWLPAPRSAAELAAALAGRPPRPGGALDVGAYVSVALGGDPEAARAAIAAYYGRPYEAVASLGDTYLGDAAGAAQWLAAYARVGAQTIVIRPVGADPARQLRALAPHLTTIRSP